MKLFEFTKLLKKEVDYSPGKDMSHCSQCKHYNNHKCELVQGKINPTYWCVKFSKK